MNLIKCEKLEKSMAELQFSIDAEAFKKAVADVFKKEARSTLCRASARARLTRL